MDKENLKRLPIFNLAIMTVETSGMLNSIQPWLTTVCEQVDNSRMSTDKKRQIQNKIAQVEVDAAKDAAGIIMETLTQEEMIALITFCSTETGRSIVSKTQPMLSHFLKSFSERFKIFQKDIRELALK